MLNFTEKHLLKKIQSGDEKSFGKIYDLHVDKIYKFVFLKINEREKTEEIVQDVFLKFWKFVQEDTTVQNITALLYKIARNLVVDYYRSKEHTQVDFSLDDANYDNLADDSASSDYATELDIKYDLAIVKEALTMLPSSYQDLIIMKYVNQLSTKEIAQAINKEEGNVRILAHRALKELKKIIQTKYPQSR